MYDVFPLDQTLGSSEREKECANLLFQFTALVQHGVVTDNVSEAFAPVRVYANNRGIAFIACNSLVSDRTDRCTRNCPQNEVRESPVAYAVAWNTYFGFYDLGNGIRTVDVFSRTIMPGHILEHLSDMESDRDVRLFR